MGLAEVHETRRPAVGSFGGVGRPAPNEGGDQLKGQWDDSHDQWDDSHEE